MNNAAEMSHRAVIHVLCVLGVFQKVKLKVLLVAAVEQSRMLQIYIFIGLFKGLTALVQTQQTVIAAVGEEAHLNCQLMQNKDVVQVTWWKPEGEKTLATSSKPFGPRVNTEFIDKVEFKDAGLQNNSIVIRNLTEQDEGCYYCLFNSYPEGALTGITCIKLYELHEPILHVRESNSPEESVVSCSATGRPAPTVTLRVLQQDLHFSNYSSVSVNNTNGTVAVTTTAVLSGYRGNSPQVGCAARVLSGPQIEVFMMITEVKQSSADGFDDQSGSKDRDLYWTLFIVVFAVGVCVHFAPFIFFLLKPKSESQSMRAVKCCSALTASSSSNLSHGDPEMNKTTNNTQKAEASSVTQESDGVRQRPSPVKTEPSDNPNPSPSTSV